MSFPSNLSAVCHFRFIQMAPLYFFYNLPPSESKDILQDMLDPDRSRNCKEQRAVTESSDADSGCAVVPQTYDRCVIQWTEIISVKIHTVIYRHIDMFVKCV